MAAVHPRVLLVEDDPRIRRILGLALRDEGCRIVEALDGRTALQRVDEEHVDVIVLDLMLPDIDGFQLCRLLRRSTNSPIIIASAKGDSHDIVAGLESGADDYVVKPVVAKELAARIRALLRRTSTSAPASDVVRSGDLEIRPREATVLRSQTLISVTTTEFRLLEVLSERPGEVVTRDELLRRVWGYGPEGDTRMVDVHMSRLRSKIEEDPGHPRHIVTVRGLGYKLAS